MAYQVGQIRRSDLRDSDLFTEQKDSMQIVDNVQLQTSFEDITFKDAGIIGSLTSGVNYYLNFTVDRYEIGHFNVEGIDVPEILKFTIVLLGTGTTSGYYNVLQTLDSYVVLPYDPSTTEESQKKANFQVLFNSTKTGVVGIGLILKRISYDYSHSDLDDEKRVLTIDLLSFGTVKNLLNKTVDKIGIQSKPGFMMCINEEGIRLGKNGIYEINNGLKVDFIGTADLNSMFIIDYATNE